MESRDVVVVGGGISGLAFAWHAARAGKKVLVLEGGERAGGCLDSRRTASGYWYELGAHTCYNSYAGLLEIIEGIGLRDRIVPAATPASASPSCATARIDMLGPISVLWRFDKGELLRNALRGLRAPKEGATTAGWYGGVVGKRNYSRILAPFLSAVPSQNVDAFPAAGPGSLFKKRERRKDVVKSFTLDGGLGAVASALAAQPGDRGRHPGGGARGEADAPPASRSASSTGAPSRRRCSRWRCRRPWRRRSCAPTSRSSRQSWRG